MQQMFRRITDTTAPVSEATSATTVIYPAEPHVWTREMVYTHPERPYLSWPPEWPGGNTCQYTAEYIEACDRETEWVQTEPTPTLAAEQEKAVGLHEIRCPLCSGSRDIPVVVRGTATGIERYSYRDCICRFLSYYWSEWQHVPRRFKRVGNIADLKPYPSLALSVERQADIIADIQSHPDHSHLLMGMPGTGKTHLLVALFRAALIRSVHEQIAKNDIRQSTWYCNATQLLSQQSAWAVEQNKEFPDASKVPSVTTAKIASAIKNGYRPCLFIDELDKAALTGPKMAALCSLINQVYESEGQLVANCNKSAAELAAVWGSDEATTILRRIGGGDGAHTILFEG